MPPDAHADETLGLLADSAAAFAAQLQAARVRGPGPRDTDRQTWRGLAEQGWLGVLVDEAHGGLGLGLAHAAVVSRELGRRAAAEPYAPALMAAVCLDGVFDTGSPLLDDVLAGEVLPAPVWPAIGESNRLAATPAGDSYRLEGRSGLVPCPDADVFLVLADLAGEPALFELRPADSGLVIEPETCADGTRMAWLSFDVALPSDRKLAAGKVVETAIARADLIGLNLASAELLGLMDGALELTLGYLRTRVQFGAAIGSFQALQHRAVDLWIQRELVQAAAQAAVARFDDPKVAEAERRRAAVGAKARASQAALGLMSQALQLHGAIGFAEEYGLGDYFNRALTLSAWLGAGAQMRRLYAQTSTLARGVAA